MEDKGNFVIVLGRQFGCGARVIGKKVAARFGIPYYDKELLHEAAKSSGVNAEVFEASDERSPTMMSSLWSFNIGFGAASYFMGTNTMSNTDDIYKAQSEVMKCLAEQGPCLIVGRTADYILRGHTNVISIFLHASLDDRINRIIDRGDCESENDARDMALKNNKLRASYYSFYTDSEWGDAATYDLTVNVSTLGVEGCVDLIEEYVKMRLVRRNDTSGA